MSMLWRLVLPGSASASLVTFIQVAMKIDQEPVRLMTILVLLLMV
jgi:hypothetical protein